MCPAIDNSVSSKIRNSIRVHQPKKMRAAEIYCELSTVYGQNVMSEKL
jgi:hypothetical protein